MAWQSSCRLLPAQKPTLQHAWQVAPCSCACPSQRLRSGAGANTAGRSGWGTPVSKTLRSGHAGGRWACAHASCLLLRSALQSSAWQLPVPRHRLPLAGLPPYRQDDPEPSRPDMCLAATGCGLPLLAPCRRPPKPAGTLHMLDKVLKTGSLHGSSCQSPTFPGPGIGKAGLSANCISTSSVLCESVAAVPYCSWPATMCGSCLFSVMACFQTVG